MPTKLGHVLEAQQFKDVRLLDGIFSLADEMRLLDKPDPSPEELKKCRELGLSRDSRRKILATLFYEPSTRTRLSFESAMISLGGMVISTESAGQFSSAAKGESLADTIKVVGGYADAIVIRHPHEGAARLAAQHSSVPVINAGDGTGQHPTQALLDLYTIRQKLGRTEDLRIGMLGDLKNGRTVHSLAYLLARRSGIRFFFISPPGLRMREDILHHLKKYGIPFEEVSCAGMKEIAKELDVLYVTRVQKERFENREDYERVKGSYVIGREVIDAMPGSSIVMHPLPRVDEISPEIDDNPKAAYFDQTKNGKYVRMAVLKMILDGY